jgi:macrodomain Ter protein organizer (MatP/YcbG family)
MFEKNTFKTREQVRKWLDSHLKSEIQSVLDFKAFDEWRRRFVNAYMNISRVEG